MMNSIKLSVIICLFFVLNLSLYAQWDLVNDGLVGDDIIFVNENAGYMLMWGGLAKTEDGGENWHRIPVDYPWSYRNFEFCDESVIWACFKSNDIYSLLKTENSGESWSEVYQLPENYFPNDISVVNDSIVHIAGYIVGDSCCQGWILKSVDNGENWLDITPDSIVDNIDWVYKIHFFDTCWGFVYYQNTSFNELSILKTTTGGATWEDLTISEFTEIYDMQITGDSTIYFTAEKSDFEPDSSIYITTDMFKTWSVKIQNTHLIYEWYIRDDNTIFANSNGRGMIPAGHIIKSTDDGKTWEIIQPVSWFPIKLLFTPANIGFIISEINVGGLEAGNILYTSVDNGETWIITKTNLIFNDLYFFDDQKGYIIGGSAPSGHLYAGYLLSTTNGGQTWSFNDSSWGVGPRGIREIGRSIIFSTDKVGFIVEGFFQGSVWKTIDGGITWNACSTNNSDSTGYSLNFFDISIVDEQSIYAVGSYQSEDSSGAAISGSYNMGDTWELVWKLSDTEETTYNLNSIHVVNNTVWVVGESGMIIKITHPDSFEVVKVSTDLPLNDVYFSDEFHGWITGGYSNDQELYSIVLKTNNGGQTWDEYTLEEYLIHDMYFPDSLHGWAAGEDTVGRLVKQGVILFSEDGGKNWTPQIIGLSAPLKALHFKDGNGWAVGEGGLVLMTNDEYTWIDPKTGEKYPKKIYLFQNYPNPFNPITKIEYQISKSEFVVLAIYNILGQKVAILVSEKQSAGKYTAHWDSTGFASGIYIYKLKVGSVEHTRKMVLLR